jgi:hypothetical protein
MQAEHWPQKSAEVAKEKAGNGQPQEAQKPHKMAKSAACPFGSYVPFVAKLFFFFRLPD